MEPPRQSAMRRLFAPKPTALIAAAAMSLAGSTGQVFFVDNLSDAAAAFGQEMRDIESKIDTLRATQAGYFNAQAQGNLLFALDPADQTKNKGIVAKLYQLSLYDRAFPFRAILGELAIAGAIQFAPVNDEYKRLQDAARADFSFANFTAVTEFERRVLDQALALQHKLQDRYFAAQAEKAQAEAARDARKLWLIALSILATCLFLVANLMGERR
jgi:hypothetical protein